MKLLNCMVICIAAIIVVSCTKKESTYAVSELNGIRITKNTGVPADSTIKIELKEVGFIDMENENDTNRFIQSASDFEFDDQGNLFVLDSKKHRVHKYDKNGNFMLAFGRNGKGPGEFYYPGFMNVRKDTLYLSNWTSLKIIKYDLKGNYICDKLLADLYKFPSYPKKFGDRYINRSTFNKAGSDNKMLMVSDITLYDAAFNFVKSLYIIEYPFTMEEEHDPSEFGSVAAFSDSVVYISENSKDRYKIDVYNSDGIKIREINKNYAKTKVNEKEAQSISEEGAKYGMKFITIYKNSINWMLTDKYGRLWVAAKDFAEDKLSFDIFENDILLNKVVLNLEKGYSPNFVGDKIVAVNRDNNNIKIYEY
jgi:hypothetical protein